MEELQYHEVGNAKKWNIFFWLTTQIFNLFTKKTVIPEERKCDYLTLIHKKGDMRKYENYWRISHISAYLVNWQTGKICHRRGVQREGNQGTMWVLDW